MTEPVTDCFSEISNQLSATSTLPIVTHPPPALTLVHWHLECFRELRGTGPPPTAAPPFYERLRQAIYQSSCSRGGRPHPSIRASAKRLAHDCNSKSVTVAQPRRRAISPGGCRAHHHELPSLQQLFSYLFSSIQLAPFYGASAVTNDLPPQQQQHRRVSRVLLA